MGLSHEDLEQIEKSLLPKIENVLLRSIKPMQDEIVVNKYTLFGPKGDNGIVQCVKTVEQKIEKWDRLFWKVAGAIGFGAALLTIFGKWVIDQIFGKGLP